jgi:hypothetical protein
MNKLELIQALYEKENSIKNVLEWSYSYDSDSEYDSDSDEDIYESFKEFCDENKEITQKVKYVYVCSGYSHRVLTDNETFLKFRDQKDKVMILSDLNWRDDIPPYVLDGRAYNLCSYLPFSSIRRGGIAYKIPDKPDGTEIKYVDQVGDLDFCAFCCAREAEANWYEIGSDILLEFTVNTESG